MFRSDLTGQPQMFAFTVRDLVAEDSDAWLYLDLFDRLDLSAFYADYVSQGQPGIDPKLMIRTIFYGLAHGIVSGRKLAEACRNEVRYIVLSGEQRPDFRTLHRFVERHHERLEALFVQVVRPVFGNIKSNKGMRILVKGRRKVGLWWKMAATAHNVEKIVGAMAA